MNELINQWISTAVALVFGTGGGIFFAKSQKRKSVAEAESSESEALHNMRSMYNDFVADYKNKFSALQEDYLQAEVKIKTLSQKLAELEKRCSKCAFKPKD